VDVNFIQCERLTLQGRQNVAKQLCGGTGSFRKTVHPGWNLVRVLCKDQDVIDRHLVGEHFLGTAALVDLRQHIQVNLQILCNRHQAFLDVRNIL